MKLVPTRLVALVAFKAIEFKIIEAILTRATNDLDMNTRKRKHEDHATFDLHSKFLIEFQRGKQRARLLLGGQYKDETF